MILTKQQILDAEDVRTEEVQVPEWKGAVLVRVMPGEARDAYEASFVGRDRAELLRNARAKLVALCIVGEDGEPLFTEADIVKLGRKSGVALERVVKVAQRLNALRDEDLEALKGN